MKTLVLCFLICFSANCYLLGQKHIFQQGKDSLLLIKSQNFKKVIIKFPDNYDQNKEYPLLIVLHGNGGTAQGILPEFNLFSMQDVIIAFPEGQYPKMVYGTIGYSWYLETEDKTIWEISDPCSVENIAYLIQELNSVYKISKNFVFGFSQGDSLAYMTGFIYPELIFGLAAVGGTLPEIDTEGGIISNENINTASNLKVLVARGNKDKLMSNKQYELQKKFFEKNKYNAFCFEYDGGHYLTKELLYKVFEWIQTKSKK